MKTVFLIRHYKLAYPFNSKENVSPEQHVNLSKGLLDPDINRDVETYILNNLDPVKYKRFELILSSPSKRTLQTAQKIKKILNLNTKVQTQEFLKECVWDPDLPGKRIDRFITGTDLSNLKDTWKRIKELDLYINKLKQNNILCVTHSFFMKILYLYYFGKFKDCTEIKYKDIKNSFHGDYLEGFEISFPIIENNSSKGTY